MSQTPSPQPPVDPVERDFAAYQMLLGLWTQENPIKTNKLQVLLAVNGLLVSAASVGEGFTARKWPVYAAGAAFSFVWVLSIGRTSLFQDAWQRKLEELRDRHPGDPRFTVLDTKPARAKAALMLRLAGGVSSRWYLVFSPVVLALAWLVLLAFSLRG